MPNVFEVELFRRVQDSVDAYKKAFKELFQAEPDVTDEDKSAMRRLLQRHKFKSSDLKLLIAAYLALEDDWLRKQGFPLRLMEKNFNSIAVSLGSQAAPKKHYVVAISESGKPCVDINPGTMGRTYWYKAVLWDDWIEQGFDERLQISRYEHEDINNDWKSWFKLWEEMDKVWVRQDEYGKAKAKRRIDGEHR